MSNNKAGRIVVEESSVGEIFRVVEFTKNGFIVLGTYDDIDVAVLACARYSAEISK